MSKEKIADVGRRLQNLVDVISEGCRDWKDSPVASGTMSAYVDENNISTVLNFSMPQETALFFSKVIEATESLNRILPDEAKMRPAFDPDALGINMKAYKGCPQELYRLTFDTDRMDELKKYESYEADTKPDVTIVRDGVCIKGFFEGREFSAWIPQSELEEIANTPEGGISPK